MIEVLNTVICYNNSDEVIEYVSKVAQLKYSDKVAVAVVVNKLDNGSLAKLREQLKIINTISYVIDPNKNLGYMNGMLKGYEMFLKKADTSNLKYIIMSNTDINYPDNRFIEKLLLSNYEKNIWSIGPAVYAPYRNNYDNPICDKRRSKREVCKLIKMFRTPILKEVYLFLSNIKGKFLKQRRGESHTVYEVHGCYFVVTRELADKMLEKPFGALLYSEEAYVAENVWHNQKKAYYDANLLVEHIEHSVTGKLNYKKLSKYIADSMEVILNDFYVDNFKE